MNSELPGYVEIRYTHDQVRECAKAYVYHKGLLRHCLIHVRDLWPEQNDLLVCELIVGILSDIDRIHREEKPREVLKLTFEQHDWAHAALMIVLEELGDYKTEPEL